MTTPARVVLLAKASPPAFEPVAPAALVRLLQLASPALPIGSFAYSQGLETAVELGLVRDEASAAEWLSGTLDASLGYLNLPVLSRLYAAWQRDDVVAVTTWSDFLFASRESAERRDEDRQLGRSLARLLSDQGVERAVAFVDRAEPTHACLFALGAVHFGIPCDATLLGFAFSWAENQVGALSRLVPLGQLAAQRVLARVGARVPAAVGRARELADDALGSTLPGVALVSALHETQYTRLFKS